MEHNSEAFIGIDTSKLKNAVAIAESRHSPQASPSKPPRRNQGTRGREDCMTRHAKPDRTACALAGVFAHERTRVRPPVRPRVEPLTVQENVLDELEVCVEAQ